MLKVLIVDDEWAAGQWLSLKLKDIGCVDSTHILQNPHEVIPEIINTSYDVVFLDIEMPEINGIEIAEKLSYLEHPPEVVFVTAYNQYAIEAFKVDALDYLVKPVREEDLNRVIEKLNKHLKKHLNNHFSSNFDVSVSSKLKARMLGTLKFYQQDREIDISFPTAKCEELFVYMILKGNEAVSKWKLIEDIWFGKDGEKGEISLRTTVYRVNKALSEAGISIKLKADKTYYKLSEKISVSDLESLESVQTISDHHQLRSIILLEDKDYFWCESIRTYYANMFYEKAWKSIEEMHLSGEKHNYLELLESFISLYPWHEEAILLALTQISKKRGKIKLKLFYDQLCEIWLKEFEETITETIESLYFDLMKS